MRTITQKNLESLVESLNRLTDKPLKPYTEGPSYKPNAGNYHLDYAYGGVSLHQMCEQGTGTRDVLSCGHVTKRTLYTLIHAYKNGIYDSTNSKDTHT